LPQTNSDQLWWAPEAFRLIWKKKETRTLILEDNGFKDPAKPQVSNRQLSVDSGTLLELLDYPTTSP
jgi:hypothetical protein